VKMPAGMTPIPACSGRRSPPCSAPPLDRVSTWHNRC